MMKRSSLLGLLVLAILITRIPYIPAMIDTDMGEVAYISWRMNHGELLYKDLFDHKPAAIYQLVGLALRFFGENFFSLKLLAFIWSLLVFYFFYRLARRFFEGNLSLLLTAIFAYFSGLYGVSLGGNFGESYTILPTILAFSFFSDFRTKNKGYYLILAGFFLAMATLIKQTTFGLLLAILGLTVIFGRKQGFIKQAFWIIVGFGGPWLVFLLYSFRTGIFNDFINQFFYYNFLYSRFSLSRFVFRPWAGFLAVFPEMAMVWILGIAGFWWGLKKLKDRQRQNMVITLFWFLGGLLGVMAGFRFFQNYFLLIIAPMVLGSGWLINQFWRRRGVREERILIKGCLFVLILGTLSSQVVKVKEELTAEQETRAKRAIEYLKKSTTSDDYVYIWGTEGRVLFGAKRISPSRYFFAFPLTTDGYKEKAVSELKVSLNERKPEIIIDASIDCGVPKLGEMKGKDWEDIHRFMNENYVLEAPIDSWLVYRLK